MSDTLDIRKTENSIATSARKWNEALVAIRVIEQNIYREAAEFGATLLRKVAPPASTQPFAGQELVPALESEFVRFNVISRIISEAELKRALVQAKILKAADEIRQRIDALDVPIGLNKLAKEDRKKLARQWKDAETFILESKTTFEEIKQEWEEILDKFEDELEGSSKPQCALC